MQIVHISYAGKSWVFHNHKQDNITMFYDRCWFIIKQNDIHKNNRALVDALADIYICKKYYSVTYPKTIEDMLQTVASTC